VGYSNGLDPTRQGSESIKRHSYSDTGAGGFISNDAANGFHTRINVLPSLEAEDVNFEAGIVRCFATADWPTTAT
jgi:hypothetical protein